MFRTIGSILMRMFGQELALRLVWVVPLLALTFAVILCLPAWRRREQMAREDKARFRLTVLFLGVVFRLVVTGAVVGGLAMALLTQADTFAEKHGRVTQRNYEAVQTKWGVPHEQQDLKVAQFVMQKVISEELADGTKGERWLPERQPPATAEEQIVLNEETPNYAPEEVRQNPHRVVRRTTAWQRVNVDQTAVDQVEVTVDLTANPRQLGGAVYAGYDDRWRLRYLVRNQADFATEASLSLALPAEGHGLFGQLVVNVDGQDWVPHVQYREGALEWRLPMAPQAERHIEVGYTSRGLEYFRYHPGDLRERCLVTVNVAGIPASRLNFPVGSMPPGDDLKSLSGDKYALHWDLSRAVTNLDVGIIVPAAEQPGYLVGCLLSAAPLALTLLAGMLLLSRWLLSGRYDLLPVALVLVGFYVAHALLANLNDVMPSLRAAFVVSMVPLAAALAVFWRLVDRRGWLPVQSGILVGVFMIIYPVLALADDLAGTLLHVVYALLVLYVLALFAWRFTRSADTPAGGGDVAGETTKATAPSPSL